MRRPTSFLTVASYLLPVAIVGCASLTYAATATTEMSSMTSLSDRLLDVGLYFSDGNGMFPVPGAESPALFVATSDGTQPFAFYTGQADESIAVIAACTVDAAGGPGRCHSAYGQTMLFALEDAQDEGADPTEMTIQCNALFGGQHHCKITWAGGGESCYLCNSAGCTKQPC